METPTTGILYVQHRKVEYNVSTNPENFGFYCSVSSTASFLVLLIIIPSSPPVLRNRIKP
jgi:hypothetical protein